MSTSLMPEMFGAISEVITSKAGICRLPQQALHVDLPYIALFQHHIGGGYGRDRQDVEADNQAGRAHEHGFELHPAPGRRPQVEYPVAFLYYGEPLLYLFELVRASRPVSFLFRLFVKGIFYYIAGVHGPFKDTIFS